jgi:hypothetical protein
MPLTKAEMIEARRMLTAMEKNAGVERYVNWLLGLVLGSAFIFQGAVLAILFRLMHKRGNELTGAATWSTTMPVTKADLAEAIARSEQLATFFALAVVSLVVGAKFVIWSIVSTRNARRELLLAKLSQSYLDSLPDQPPAEAEAPYIFRPWQGFIGGSMVGGVALAGGALCWGVMVLFGIEQISRSNPGTGLWLAPSCILTFGLAGLVFGRLWKQPPRWYHRVCAWAGGVVILLAGCALIDWADETGRPALERWIGAVSAVAWGLLFAWCVIKIRKARASAA